MKWSARDWALLLVVVTICAVFGAFAGFLIVRGLDTDHPPADPELVSLLWTPVVALVSSVLGFAAGRYAGDDPSV